jgi:D-methionine transport system ATP-binding protein
MISFENISVDFLHRKKEVAAVKDVSFEIRQGEIFGIVGTSGAGKSTLLRTINLLQRPTSGNMYVDNANITDIKGEALRQLRLQIGMIFQQFNLIHTKTVYENIALALKIAGKSKEETNRRVAEVLELVGLTDRATAYPSTLSGGQKQRVGIARAIANNPKILLCDEPTSALDLETTDSILRLLKDINQKLGITTVIISHEMNVIKKICDRVAVMSHGEILELGDVFDVFATPRHDFTRRLINYTINLELPPRLLNDDKSQLLKIVYNGEKAEEAIISETIKRFDVKLNILHGKIEYITDKALGVLLVRIEGDIENISKAKEYLKNRTYKVEIIYGN